MKKKTGLRGFASLDPETRKRIASMGGKSVPPEKRMFYRDRKLAASAASVGGSSVAPENRTFSTDNELASAAGRKGGLARRGFRKIAAE